MKRINSVRNLVIMHLGQFFEFRSLFALCVVLSLFSWMAASPTATISDAELVYRAGSVWDAIFVVFSGFGEYSIDIISVFAWSILHIFILFKTGNVYNDELEYIGYPLIPRVGSRRAWFLSKLIGIAVQCFIYLCVALVVVFLTALLFLPCTNDFSAYIRLNEMLQVPENVSPIFFLFFFLLLTIGTTLNLSAMQNIIGLITKKPAYGFLFSSSLILLPMFVGVDSVIISRWLPSTQSMLIRHGDIVPSIDGFSFLWSLIYNTVLLAILCVIGVWVAARVDITTK